MPVLSPEFQDPTAQAQTTLAAEQQGNNNVTAQQNWMTQAAQRAQIGANTAETQQNTQQQAAQFAALLPVLQAKSQADVITQQNDLAAAIAIQNMRASFQSMKPDVVKDIAQINDPKNVPKEPDGTPDWNAISNKYENLQAKYAGLALLPESKQYYDMIEQGKKNAYDLAARHTQAQLTLNQMKLGAQYRVQGQEAVQGNKAALDAQTKPAVAQTEAINKERNQDFNDISNQRDALGQMNFYISKLGDDLKAEQASPVAAGASRILGPGLVGKVSDPVRQVQQDIGDFATNIMSKVKNIRNINEFNAVTASLPHADDQPSVQNQKLEKLQQVNQVLSQRNDYMEKALRGNPSITRDQADLQATQQYPFPNKILAPAIFANPPKSMTDQDRTALEYAKSNPNDPKSALIIQHLSTLQ